MHYATNPLERGTPEQFMKVLALKPGEKTNLAE
jgi:hypothetical protein